MLATLMTFNFKCINDDFCLDLGGKLPEDNVGLRTLNERIHLLIALPIFYSPWGVIEFGSQPTLPAG